MIFFCAGFGLLYKPIPLQPVEPEKTSKAQELEPLRQALSKLSEEDEIEDQDNDVGNKATTFAIPHKFQRTQSQMSLNATSEQAPSTRPESEVPDKSDDPAMARLKSALSECEDNDDASNQQASSRPPLSPLPENQPSGKAALKKEASTDATRAAAPPPSRPRKLTLTRFFFFNLKIKNEVRLQHDE